MRSGDKTARFPLSGNVQRSGRLVAAPPAQSVDTEPIVTAYVTRVEADGGSVTSLEFVQDFVNHAAENWYLDDVACFLAPAAGVKLASDAVEKMYDLSNNAYDVGPAGSGTLPTFVPGTDASAPNGQASAVFVPGTAEVQSLLAWPQMGLTRNIAGLTAISVRRSSNTSGIKWEYAIETGAGALRVLGGTESVDTLLGGRRLDADSYASRAAANTHTSEWQMVTRVWDYANAAVAMRVDGAPVTLNNSSFHSAGNTSDTDAAKGELGASSVLADRSMNGTLAALIFFESVLSPAKLAAVEGWLWDRFVGAE